MRPGAARPARHPLELQLGDAAGLRDRPPRRSRRCPRGRRDAGSPPTGCTSLAALPRIDGRSDGRRLAVGRRSSWSRSVGARRGTDRRRRRCGCCRRSVRRRGPAAPRRPEQRRCSIGIEEGDLAAGRARLRRQDQHLVVLGDAESGKTSFLRAIAAPGASPARTPARPASSSSTTAAACSASSPATACCRTRAAEQRRIDTVAGLVEGFRERLPGPGRHPRAAARPAAGGTAPRSTCSWTTTTWSPPAGNPLLPLVEFLPQARDIGLHLYVCRRAGGASRALVDPVIGRARELASPAVVLSGPRDEGTLFGVRPSQLPAGRGTLVHRRFGTVPVQLVRDSGFVSVG